jgi:hypothetical protein
MLLKREGAATIARREKIEAEEQKRKVMLLKREGAATITRREAGIAGALAGPKSIAAEAEAKPKLVANELKLGDMAAAEEANTGRTSGRRANPKAKGAKKKKK